MGRIQFPGRAVVVKQVQRALNLKDDGDDRRVTWQAIAAALPLTPLPRIGPSLAVQFPARDALTERVQKALGGIMVDGEDGAETWSALAQRFDPLLKQLQVSAAPVAKANLVATGGRYEERVRGRTPNRNQGANERKGLVIHHASGYFEGTISWCLQKGTEAGYHCLINTDGTRAVLAEDTDRTHHAGKSIFKGRSGCNAFMLGLCFIGNTNDGAMRGGVGPVLTRHEVLSACEWIRPRMFYYGWTKDWITAHRIVSPGRKDDTSVAALKQILDALL